MELINVIILIGSVLTAVGSIWRFCGKPIKQLAQKIDRIDGDTADLLWDRLVQMHDHYINRGWATTVEKERVAHVFRSYKQRGRNHLAENYFDDVLALPLAPKGD